MIKRKKAKNTNLFFSLLEQCYHQFILFFLFFFTDTIIKYNFHYFIFFLSSCTLCRNKTVGSQVIFLLLFTAPCFFLYFFFNFEIVNYLHKSRKKQVTTFFQAILNQLVTAAVCITKEFSRES